jgi:site-specific recombinase XerD
MFFTISNPPRSFRDPAAISRIVQRNLVRAGIPLGRLTGAHMLRHTAATRMVNSGASFREIADLLGHQSLSTTAIYAKLDLKALARVSLPWMGGQR